MVPSWEVIHTKTSGREIRLLSLVLEARGVPHRVRHTPEPLILVPSAHAERARIEIDAFLHENEGWPPIEEPLPTGPGQGITAAVSFGIVLLAFFLAERYQLFGRDWWEPGLASAGAIRSGEIWRIVTALTLHVDGQHLISNLVFGMLFVAFVARDLGAGIALYAILLSGAFGNAMNAWLQAAAHTSVGASTAVFGAIGILVASQWRLRKRFRTRRARRLAPLVVGAVLLGYLGFSGERTDVTAHVTGLVSGAGFGIVLGAIFPLWHSPQLIYSMLSILVLVGSWVAAFLW